MVIIVKKAQAAPGVPAAGVPATNPGVPAAQTVGGSPETYVKVLSSQPELFKEILKTVPAAMSQVLTQTRLANGLTLMQNNGTVHQRLPDICVTNGNIMGNMPAAMFADGETMDAWASDPEFIMAMMQNPAFANAAAQNQNVTTLSVQMGQNQVGQY